MDLASRTIRLRYAHDHWIYGTGIGVAIVDTGICQHPDFLKNCNRKIYFKDFIHQRNGLYDDCGHGSHVAGIIGGSGYASGGKYMGVAPNCNLIMLKTLNYKGDGNISDVLIALDWIVKHKEELGIRIVNLSFGMGNKEISQDGRNLIQAVENVWNSGIVVVAAAGNGGPNLGSVAVPGSSKKIITVGASDDNIEVELMGNRAKNYSGRGPTYECIKKPDIVAPASNIMSCALARSYGTDMFRASNINRFTANMKGGRERYGNFYTEKSGTSMATPIVSGAIALLLSIRPNLTPKEVKIKLRDSCVSLGEPQSKQGWGLLNIENLLKV